MSLFITPTFTFTLTFLVFCLILLARRPRQRQRQRQRRRQPLPICELEKPAVEAPPTMQYLLANPQQLQTPNDKKPVANVAPKTQLRQEPRESQDHDHPTSLMKPQLHSRKYHHTYNATRCLPRAVWLRSARVRDSVLVYEVLLYYDHNRACTIYRTWDDLRRLKSGLGDWKNAPPFCSMQDVEGVQRFLCEAVNKKGRAVAMEYFLRRRIDDCAGA